jgi:hypothetical protein
MEVPMLRQFLVGGGVAIINIAIHAFVMSLVIAVAQRGARTKVEHPALFLAAVMIPTVSVLMATHALEVMVWALAYSIVDAAPPGTDWMYFAFVNYATLGLRRYRSSATMAIARPNRSDERSAHVRLVYRSYF